MMVSGYTNLEMVTANKDGLMDLCTKVCGNKAKQMVKVNFTTQMAIFTKVNG